MQLAGTYTALITPFNDGRLDEARLRANLDDQLAAGITGVVPVGTTGESPTLSHDEHRRVIDLTAEHLAGRCQVIAGTGSNSTAEAIALTQHAKAAGVDAALLVNPYYNKPNQDGLTAHFLAIADAVELPLVLYNIPGRTNILMAPATAARLAEHPNIIGIKDATGSMDIASELAAETDLAVISGDDSMTLPLMAVGGTGVISVLSNLMPERVKALVDAAAADDLPLARTLHQQLFALCKGLLTLGTNPIPIKAAMAIAGRDTGELRLPLTPLDDSTTAKLQALLIHAGLTPQPA
ncbi:MAG: 4-hydroxy-tetrahydrodipicolinate synthase [Planctomycetota bacterium]